MGSRKCLLLLQNYENASGRNNLKTRFEKKIRAFD